MRTIDLHPQCHAYPGELLLVETSLERAKQGQPFSYSWDWEVLTASVDGVVVAAMAFTHSKWQRQLFVNMGGTHPDHRRQGHYRALWERLVEIAQERDAKTIASGYGIDNLASAAMHKALGRPVFGIATRFDVPQKEVK